MPNAKVGACGISQYLLRSNICSVKTAATFGYQGQLENHTKTVSRHAEVQISGRFGSNPAVFIPRSVEKRGDQSRFKSLG